MKKFKGLFEQHREVGRFKPVKPHDVKPIGPRPAVDSASAGLEEGSVQDKLHAQHQELRKKSGLPHPDYYKELGKSYDIENDNERYAKQSEIRKKYGIKEDIELNELKDTTLKSYFYRAKTSRNVAANKAYAATVGQGASKSEEDKQNAKIKKRETGMERVKKRIDMTVKPTLKMHEEIQQLDEMPGANMDTRAVHQHLKKHGWSISRTSGGHDVFTHPDAEHHIAVPRHRQLKAPLVKGILKASKVNEEIELEKNSAAARTYKEKPEKQPMEKMREMKDPCWKGYEMVGQKEKNGKKVPNCVPVKEEKEPPFDKPYKKNTGTVTDKSGAKHTSMSMVRDLARKALKKQSEKMKPMKECLDESRKAEIVKDIVKKKKKETKESDDKFQPDPILTSQIVKEDK